MLHLTLAIGTPFCTAGSRIISPFLGVLHILINNRGRECSVEAARREKAICACLRNEEHGHLLRGEVAQEGIKLSLTMYLC